MTAQEALKRLVAEQLAPAMKAHGLKRKGLYFVRRVGDNFGLVQLQKSRHSTADSVRFTFNVSVFSARVHCVISEFMWVPNVTDVPAESTCQVRMRIGLLMPAARDTWWTVDDQTNLEELGASLGTVLVSYAVPFLGTHTTDEQLRDYWSATATEWSLNLAALLSEIGPEDAFQSLVAKARRASPPPPPVVRDMLDRLAAKHG